jgi:hypothetical protein
MSVFGLEARLNESSGLTEVLNTDTYWIQGFVIPWSSVEPNKGDRNWSTIANIEERIRTASRHGFSPIVRVYSTPGWAQADPPYNKPCGRIKDSEYPSFANFMENVVQRYSKHPYNVKYWEIWNEPDIDPRISGNWIGCWGDEADPYYGGGVYGDMLEIVSPAMKGADSEANVIVGGLLLDCRPQDSPDPSDPCSPANFLEGILVSGGGPHFDGIGFHSYDYYNNFWGRYGNLTWQSYWDNGGPVINAKADFIQSLLEEYTIPNKFLMNLESAVLCDPSWGLDCGSPFEVTKAYYIAQAYTVAIAQGLLANVWYSVLGWPDRNTALLDGNLNPLPAYNAYKFTASILGSSTFVRVIPPNELQNKPVYGYELDRGDRNVWVLWAHNDGNHLVTLPDTPHAIYLISSTGEAVSIPLSTTLSTSVAPMFIEWP